MFHWTDGCLFGAPEDPAYDLVIATAEVRLEDPEIAAQLVARVRPRA